MGVLAHHRRLRSSIGVAAGAVGLLAALGAAPAAAQYPSPPPDFSHPGTPHFADWSPAQGAIDRPHLVIELEYSDFAFPATPTVTQLSNRFFGGYPSVADYLAKQSFGALVLTRAQESDTSGGGAVNDGVVRVKVNVSQDDFDGIEPGEPDPPDTFAAMHKLALEAANPSVNFASFDRDNNNQLTRDELIVTLVKSNNNAGGCGITGASDAVTLDGKTFASRVAQITTTTNLITAIHEAWHAMWWTSRTDIYNFGMGSLDISGPTCNSDDDLLFGTAAWMKLHLGWITPTVVTRDGYYDIRQADDTRHDAFILYDHGRGTNDYFVVENRQARDGTYDEDPSDSGLVIWRIDDTQWASTNGNVRAVDIMRPDGTTAPGCPAAGCGGSSIDAWDPASTATPQRAMERSWRDGTASNVAVRAIGRSGATMRAFFDVRGPGVLVDTFTLDPGGENPPGLPRLAPGEPNSISIPVRNTGEASDTFTFAATDLPAGWSATSHTLTLGPGQDATATIRLTPPLDAPAEQLFPVTVVGRSTTDSSVSSTAPLRVEVMPKLQIDDVSVTEGDSGTQDATFTVTLSQPVRREVTVDFATFDGTATAPEDYGARSGELRLGRGATTRQITVPVNGDTAPEPDEHFFVRLSNAHSAKIVDGEGRGTIATDPEPSLSIDDVRIDEESADAIFTVSLSEANNTPVSVDYSTADGSATAPADYASTAGTVDFPTGTTSRTIAVPVKEDFVDEPDEETFRVQLSNVVHANIADGEGTGTIRDDDRNGVFSCRAVGARIGDSERGVANPERVPCRDATGTGFPLRLGSGLVTVSADGGAATTNQTPDVLTGTAPQPGDSATAHAEATNLTIRVGLNVIRVAGFVADAKAECVGAGPPRLTSSSRVTLLTLNGAPVLTATGQTTIPLLFATIRLNQTVTGPNEVTRRALVVDNATGPDVVLGEARAGFAGTEAHPDGHPCVA
jgi:M6 family metalloprotease-like protein